MRRLYWLVCTLVCMAWMSGDLRSEERDQTNTTNPISVVERVRGQVQPTVVRELASAAEIAARESSKGRSFMARVALEVSAAPQRAA